MMVENLAPGQATGLGAAGILNAPPASPS